MEPRASNPLQLVSASLLPSKIGRWNPVKGDYIVTVNGAAVTPTTLILPDAKKYEAAVKTLCGGDLVKIEATPGESMTAAEFARRVQIVASIGHVTRRGCEACYAAYQHGLTIDEKKLLYSTQPSLGPVLGFGGLVT